MRFFYLIIMLFFSTQTFAGDYKWSNFRDQHVDPFLQRSVDSTSLTLLATGLVAFYVTTPADNNIRSEWRNHQKISKDDSHAGDLMGSGAGGALLIGSQYFFDSNRDHWIQHTRALVWGAMITTVLKYSLNRQRPGNSDSHLSLPSGHTATAFTTATSLTYAYGWKAAVLAYPVAAFVGLSRLSDDVHWGSDVVAGAFLGYIIGRASAYETPEQTKYAADKYGTFYPVIAAGQSGLGWIYTY
ncbi:MAG: phosphatase PAP2 family protein [Bdellovibrio sp.]|nr:phosphatase PAP2 family protein [Bdellovibrio sp.]